MLADDPHIHRVFIRDENGNDIDLTGDFVRYVDGDRELIAKLPLVPNDSTEDGARENASADGYRAGRAAVPDGEIDDPDGRIAGRFVDRGEAKARNALASSERQVATLRSTSGDAVSGSLMFRASDPELRRQQRRARRRQMELEAVADAALRARMALKPMRRGLIRADVELIATLTLGAADVVTLYQFLSERAALTAVQSWFAAALAGVAAAVAGWVAGRAAAGLASNDQKVERRTLVVMLLLVLGVAVWFIVALVHTRNKTAELGVAASITFGAPLSAITLTGSALVSFVAGAGSEGFELRRVTEEALAEARLERQRVDHYSSERLALRREMSDGRGRYRAARDQIDAVRSAATEEADGWRADGRALWGLFAGAAKTARVRNPKAEPVVDEFALDRLREREEELERTVVTLTRLTTLLLAGLGAVVVITILAAVGLGVPWFVLGGALGAGVGVWRAPRVPERPRELDDVLRVLAERWQRKNPPAS